MRPVAKSNGNPHDFKIAIKNDENFLLCARVKGPSILQNNFSQKAVEEMLKKHMGISTKREKKVVSECIKNAMIFNMANEHAIPPMAFKKAMLTASVHVKGLKKTHLRTQIMIEARSIPFTFESMTTRMDHVRLSGQGRTPDVRFRPEFHNWECVIPISFTEGLNSQTVIDLLCRAGKVGVCEWRPERDGTFGTFVVDEILKDSKEINAVLKACAVPLVPIVVPEWAMNAEIDVDLMERIARSQEGHESEEEASL